MKDGRGSPLDIDEYIAGFPIEIGEIPRRLRKSIQALARRGRREGQLPDPDVQPPWQESDPPAA